MKNKNIWKLFVSDLQDMIEVSELPNEVMAVDRGGCSTEYHRIPNTNQYISTDFIWECLLGKYKKAIDNMYDHGYPEDRLIPSNHYSDCEEAFKDMVKNDILAKVDAYLDGIIENN